MTSVTSPKLFKMIFQCLILKPTPKILFWDIIVFIDMNFAYSLLWQIFMLLSNENSWGAQVDYSNSIRICSLLFSTLFGFYEWKTREINIYDVFSLMQYFFLPVLIIFRLNMIFVRFKISNFLSIGVYLYSSCRNDRIYWINIQLKIDIEFGCNSKQYEMKQ